MVERLVRVDLSAQMLEVEDSGVVVASYPVSTASKGAGEQQDSEQTPRGRHEIRAKIGAGAAPGTVFVSRRRTGEICDSASLEADPDRDWILTRILWLRGLERGRNRHGSVDTMRRYIYIHGTPHEEAIGEAASHGCIRMRNADVIELFDLVEVGDIVQIHE